MTYRGDVAPGGPPDVRELASLIITKVSVGPMDNNAYFLRCPTTGDELLIDAAAEPERLVATVGDGPLRSILTTHRHPDHWGALATVTSNTAARTLAHPSDAPEIGVVTTHPIVDGDVLTVGSVSLQVLHLPGHTPGSIAVLYDDPQGPPHVWTGDSLFPGGPGATTPETFPVLMESLITKVFDQLPDETWIYPGHGSDTVLGNERPHLSEWIERGW